MNKKEATVLLIGILIAGICIGSIGSAAASWLTKKNVASSEPVFSKESCELLNTFREEPGSESAQRLAAGDSNNYNNAKPVDFRTEEKYSQHPSKNSINIPIYELILSPGKYGNIFNSEETSFICHRYEDFGPNYQACTNYFPHLMSLMYNKTSIKMDIIEAMNSSAADEWVYYDFAEQLERDTEYIVFYPEMDFSNFTVLNPNLILDKQYLEQRLQKDKKAKIICTNDFSCMHAWAATEKLHEYGFGNVLNPIKLLNIEKSKSSTLENRSENSRKEIEKIFLDSIAPLKGAVSGNLFRISKGDYTLEKTINVPEHLGLEIEAGTRIYFKNNGSIASYNDLAILGAKGKPVYFKLSQGLASTPLIVQGGKKSRCIIQELRTDAEKSSSDKDSILLNRCKQTTIINSSIIGIYATGGNIGIINSTFTTNNPDKDTLGTEHTVMLVQNSRFIGSKAGGDSDLFDSSGSIAIIKNSQFENTNDKGLILDEDDLVIAYGCSFNDNKLAVRVKNNATLILVDNSFSGNELDIKAYEEYAGMLGGTVFLVGNSFEKEKIIDIDNSSKIIELKLTEEEKNMLDGYIRQNSITKALALVEEAESDSHKLELSLE